MSNLSGLAPIVMLRSPSETRASRSIRLWNASNWRHTSRVAPCDHLSMTIPPYLHSPQLPHASQLNLFIINRSCLQAGGHGRD